MNKIMEHWLLGAVVAAGLAVGACGAALAQDEASLRAAAEKEGEIRVYIALGESLIADLVKAFEEKYKVDVDAQRLNGSEQVALYETEKQANAPTADVLMHSDRPHFDAIYKRGDLVSLAELPAAMSWPEEFWAAGVDKHAVNYSIGQYTVIWNTDIVKSEVAPRNWEAVLNLPSDIPLALVDPRQADQYIARYGRLIEKMGPDFLDKLLARANFMFTSTAPGVQSLAAGEYGVMVMASWDPMRNLQLKGSPLDGWSPADYVGGSERTAAVIAGAEHPNAALLWVNFLMTPEAQAIINGGKYNTISPLPGVEGAQQVTPDFWMTDYSYIDKYKQEVLDKFATRFR